MEQENNQMMKSENQETTLELLRSKYFPVKNPRTGLDVFKSSGRSLAFIGANEGQTKVKALLTLLISDTLDLLSITNSMGDNQIVNCVNLIIEEYSTCKIDFFVLCFNNAVKGKYGKVYNRLDTQIIFEWLSQCYDEYSFEVEAERVNEKKRIEKDIVPDEPGVPMPDNIKEMISSLGKKPIDSPKETHISDQQRIINAYLKDFDLIFSEQDDMSGGKRFINCDGRMMDITEYMEWRIEFDPID